MEPIDEASGRNGRRRAIAIASSRLADGVARTERWTERVNRRNVVAFIAPYLVIGEMSAGYPGSWRGPSAERRARRMEDRPASAGRMT